MTSPAGGTGIASREHYTQDNKGVPLKRSPLKKPVSTMKITAPDHTNAADRGDPTPSEAIERDIPAICADMVDAIGPQLHGDFVRLQPCLRRDQLLGEYRRALLAHIHHDTRVNLVELRALVRETSDCCGLDFAQTLLGADLLARVDASFDVVTRLDPYRNGKTELKWWLALTQFYLDGLYLADRLLAAKPGEPQRRWRLPRRRVDFLGFSIPGRAQALVATLETAVPDIFRVNPFDTYLPLLLHLLAHHVFPGKRFSFTETFATTFGWTRRGGFSKLRGLSGTVVRFEGLEHLHNDELFDLDTWRTRHNVIIAASHRLGYLDWPLFFEPLRKLRFGVWANNAFFGPAVEKKIARDRYSIPVAGSHAPPLEVSLAQTADVMIDARVPVFIMVDGCQPSLFYGQQMRVKRGVRLAVNETIRRSQGTGRRTYVLPLSLNDPVGFVCGRQDMMRVAFHPPILVESVLELQRPESSATESASAPHSSHGGDCGIAKPAEVPDPLLSHLESLFLLNTTHAERGLSHPRIIATARRRLRNRHREPLLKRPFHTSIADLSQQAADTNPA